VLASISPRRRELLNYLGVDFTVIPSSIEEFVDLNLSPESLVIKLASAKVEAVQKKLMHNDPFLDRENTIIIGADTIVVLEETVLNKPASREEAVQMLSRLSGKTHKVYTGVAVLNIDQSLSPVKEESFCEMSKVTFRSLSNTEIEAYVDTGEPMDKAGSYALQGIGSTMVESIHGCYTNVIGLPMPKLVLLLRSMGVQILGKQPGAKIC
jgi:septum formation protein